MRGAEFLRTASVTLLLATIFLTGTEQARAGADEEWAAILELEKGPQEVPTSEDDAKAIARRHFDKHDAALRAFIIAHPEDPRAFDARVRIASIMATVGKMEGDQQRVDAALKHFTRLEKTEGIPRQKIADVAYRRVSLYIQSLRQQGLRARENILTSIQNYAARFPEDKRSPRLLVEGATLLDDQPHEKREILAEARRLTSEEALIMRIDDDFRRMDQLGQPVDLKLSTIQGGAIDTKQLRGKVVAILFWAAESPHCLLWIDDFRKWIAKVRTGDFEVVTVSLDTNREILDQVMEAERIDWPTHYTGEGWETPIARKLGINALPTLWLLDREGRLVTLNARGNYETWIRKLLSE